MLSSVCAELSGALCRWSAVQTGMSSVHTSAIHLHHICCLLFGWAHQEERCAAQLNPYASNCNCRCQQDSVEYGCSLPNRCWTPVLISCGILQACKSAYKSCQCAYMAGILSGQHVFKSCAQSSFGQGGVLDQQKHCRPMA